MQATAAANIRKKAIKDTKLVRKDEKLIEISNGCICCNRRQDLLAEVRELAAEGGEGEGGTRRRLSGRPSFQKSRKKRAALLRQSVGEV